MMMLRLPNRGRILISDSNSICCSVVLLLLIAGEDADLGDVGVQEAVEHRVAEGAGAAGDKQFSTEEPDL